MTVQPNAAPAAAAVHDMSPRLRVVGIVNWRGVWTLYLKEVRRFLKVFTQTVAAPVVTTFLFYFVFAVAFGAAARSPKKCRRVNSRASDCRGFM